VGNNPIARTDPTGLACTTGTTTVTDEDGATTSTTTTVCNDNNGVFFDPFDTPDGWQDPKGDWQLLYHVYDYQAGLSTCLAALQQDLVDNPAPGSASPATEEGTLNNASPGSMTYEPVKSYTGVASNGSPYIINITQPGHILHPGFVVRMGVGLGGGGGNTVRNFGEGLSALQSRLAPPRIRSAINGIFKDLSEDAAQRANEAANELPECNE